MYTGSGQNIWQCLCLYLATRTGGIKAGIKCVHLLTKLYGYRCISDHNQASARHVCAEACACTCVLKPCVCVCPLQRQGAWSSHSPHIGFRTSPTSAQRSTSLLFWMELKLPPLPPFPRPWPRYVASACLEAGAAHLDRLSTTGGGHTSECLTKPPPPPSPPPVCEAG